MTLSIRNRVTSVLLSAAAATGIALAAAPAADASTTSCGGGRCTVYLSKSETRAMAAGRAPALPAAVPIPLRVSYTALVQGHRWIAQQYANQGKCSAFRLSIYPWESQGYAGYSCNWN